MTKIICRASDCVFWDEGICSSEEITYDPENGCLTYEGIEDVVLDDDDEWEEEDGLEEDDSLEWDDDEEDIMDEDDENDDWDV